jgi:hypothetical protein
MLRRREFLKHSVIVATAASSGILTANASTDRTTRVDFVVFDEELEDSLAFARELAARGARELAVQQDIGRLWFGELGQAFASGTVIAGLTSHSELLVCAAFAREHGAHIRYEGSHDCRGGDVLTHSLRVAMDAKSLGADLALADTDWPRVLAHRTSELAECAGPLREDRCRTSTRRTASHPGSLFSWVIA